MAKWQIYLMTMLMLITAVTATESFTPGVNHSIYSPYVVGCGAFNYTIDNGTAVLSDRPLTDPLANKYKLWFNLTVGDYRVTLCDNTTMSLTIEPEGVDDMYTGMALLVGISLLMFALVFWLANNIRISFENLSTMENAKNSLMKAKVDMIIKGIGLIMIILLNLSVTGFLYYITNQLNADLTDMALVYFVINLIAVGIIAFLVAWRMFMFPWTLATEAVKKWGDKD